MLPGRVVLWDALGGTCPCSQAVRIALHEKNVPYVHRAEVDMDNKTSSQEFVQSFRTAAGPEEKVAVPLLLDGEVALTESAVICAYIEEAMPGPQLMPAAPPRRASVRYISELFRGRLGPGSSGGVHELLAARNSGELERVQRIHLSGLQALESGLHIHSAGAGPFVEGDAWSLAETAAAPWLARMQLLLPACRGVNTIQMARQAGLQRVADWIQAIVDRPSVRESTPALVDMQRVWANCIPAWEEMTEVDRSRHSFADMKARMERSGVLLSKAFRGQAQRI